MNREFKFRVWDKVNNKMLYWESMIESETIGSFLDSMHPNYRFWELMQWTGLLDKNDRDVYEGDVLQHTTSTMRKVVKGYVSFVNGRFVLTHNKVLNKMTGKLLEAYIYPFIKNFEVIGNIYENPELLK